MITRQSKTQSMN